MIPSDQLYWRLRSLELVVPLCYPLSRLLSGQEGIHDPERSFYGADVHHNEGSVTPFSTTLADNMSESPTW